MQLAALMTGGGTGMIPSGPTFPDIPTTPPVSPTTPPAKLPATAPVMAVNHQQSPETLIMAPRFSWSINRGQPSL